MCKRIADGISSYEHDTSSDAKRVRVFRGMETNRHDGRDASVSSTTDVCLTTGELRWLVAGAKVSVVPDAAVVYAL